MLHTRQIDQPALFLLGALTLGLFLWRWHVSRRSISYIPGPKASWLYGTSAVSSNALGPLSSLDRERQGLLQPKECW